MQVLLILCINIEGCCNHLPDLLSIHRSGILHLIEISTVKQQRVSIPCHHFKQDIALLHVAITFGRDAVVKSIPDAVIIIPDDPVDHTGGPIV